MYIYNQFFCQLFNKKHFKHKAKAKEVYSRYLYSPPRLYSYHLAMLAYQIFSHPLNHYIFVAFQSKLEILLHLFSKYFDMNTIN